MLFSNEKNPKTIQPSGLADLLSTASSSGMLLLSLTQFLKSLERHVLVAAARKKKHVN